MNRIASTIAAPGIRYFTDARFYGMHVLLPRSEEDSFLYEAEREGRISDQASGALSLYGSLDQKQRNRRVLHRLVPGMLA